MRLAQTVLAMSQNGDTHRGDPFIFWPIPAQKLHALRGRQPGELVTHQLLTKIKNRKKSTWPEKVKKSYGLIAAAVIGTCFYLN
jgi:hypothetical protein